jgi:WD40 repeat protein/serine/threonine protein kinase
MSTETRVSDLLLQWEERLEQGQPVSLEELCRDCPHLLDELRRRAAALQAMNPFVQQPAGVPGTPTLADRRGHDRPALSPPPPRQASLSLPTISGYEVLRELGRGGMGVVYLARQTSLGRLVALKMILADSHTTPKDLQRFKTEVELAARLQHPNIVTVYEVGEVQGRPYCVLEFIEGCNLAEALAGAPCPPRQAAELLATLARAVQAAHARGIVHRDLKPANILLQRGLPAQHAETAEDVAQARANPEPTSRLPDRAPTYPVAPVTKFSGSFLANTLPKIADFGLAKRLDGNSNLTTTGQIMGTPTYMAPEQAQGKKTVGPLADIYSLGAIFYELLTGRPPLLGATPLETLTLVLHQEPVPPHGLNPKVPRDLETICLKCLRKEPEKRYPSAQALAEDLERFLAGETIRARPISAFDRLMRWCRKNPAVAALGAFAFLLLVTLAVVSSIGYIQAERALAIERQLSLEAGVQHKQAVINARKAASEEKKAREEAARNRMLLYAADMQLAEQLWENEFGSSRRIAEVLDKWIPREPQEDLREFCWRYQWGRLNAGAGRFTGHRGPILRGAWRADGKLITIDGKHVVRCWDPKAAKELASFSLGEVNKSSKIDLSADGRVAALLSRGRRIFLFDPATGKKTQQFANLKMPADAIHLSPDGKFVLVCDSSAGRVQVWESATGRLVEKSENLADLSRTATAMALSPDGATFAIREGTANERVRWLRPKSNRTSEQSKTGLTFYDLAFSYDGKRLAGGNFMGRVFLWEVDPFKLALRLDAHFQGTNRVAFSADGKRLASGGNEGGVAVTNLVTQKVAYRAKGHTRAVSFVSLSPDGKQLASGSRDGSVRLWDLDQPIGFRELHDGGRVTHLAVSPDGRWLAVVQNGNTRLWEVGPGKLVRTMIPPEKQSVPLRAAFAPVGKLLATANQDGTVHLWDVESGKFLRSLAPPRGEQNQLSAISLVFSPKGDRLVVGHGAFPAERKVQNDLAHVWDVQAGKVVAALPHAASVSSLVFLPDGALLLSGCGDGKVRSWDTAEWRLLRSWTAPAPVASLAVSPDGKLAAAGLTDGIICLKEIDSDKAPELLREHSRRIEGVAFTPDGKTLASAGDDVTVRLWHVPTRRSLMALRGHVLTMRGLVVMPDGNAIVSADRTGNIRLWQAPSLPRIEELLAERR